MRWRLTALAGAAIAPDGALVDHAGRPTGLRVIPGGHQITDERGRQIGTVTRLGAVYDGDSRLVTQVVRQDLQAAGDDPHG